MNQVLKVIRALDDSMERSITYKNRNWLYENIEDLKVDVKETGAIHLYISEVQEKALKRGSKIIQAGKELRSVYEINPLKEALILEKEVIGDGYFVYLYTPVIYDRNFIEKEK